MFCIMVSQSSLLTEIRLAPQSLFLLCCTFIRPSLAPPPALQMNCPREYYQPALSLPTLFKGLRLLHKKMRENVSENENLHVV